MSSRRRGQYIEMQARIYLERQGLIWILSNYRCSRGEIDLIMQESDMLVFIEVRYRRNEHYGNGAETVQPYKQRRLIAAAQQYLLEKRWTDKVNCRFDVIGLSDFGAIDTEIDWIQNAFEVQY